MANVRSYQHKPYGLVHPVDFTSQTAGFQGVLCLLAFLS